MNSGDTMPEHTCIDGEMCAAPCPAWEWGLALASVRSDQDRAPLDLAIYESIREMDQWRAAQTQSVAPRPCECAHSWAWHGESGILQGCHVQDCNCQEARTRFAEAAGPRVEELEQAIEFLDGIVMIAERPGDQRATHKEEMAAIRWMASNAVRLLYESLAGSLDERASESEASHE